MSSDRTIFAISLGTGSTPEPRVGNSEFLDSYVRFGVWLRVVPAFQQFSILTASSTTQLARICATAVFFEQMGMLYEDTVCNLAAWIAWSHNRELLLADLLKCIVLKRGAPPTGTSTRYLEEVATRLRSVTKRVDVNPSQLLQDLAALPAQCALEKIGIAWKSTPPATEVSPEERPDWNQLPMLTDQLLKHISAPGGELLSAYYNKIKHGPQLVVANVHEVAARRGLPEMSREELPTGNYLRALLDGARTQERAGQHEGGNRVAPFLIHDAYFIDKLFFEVMVFTANAMWRIATWLQRVVLHVAPPRDLDPVLRDILSQAYRRASERAAIS